MNANFLKSLYLKIKSNRLRYYSIALLKILNLRYRVVRFDTNHNCNLRCKMCHFNNTDIKRLPRMDFGLYQKIAKEVFPKTRVLFLSCNAEPLCTSNISDYLKVAKNYGVPFVSMTSNCMLLSDKIIDGLIDNKLDELIVSVTGGTKETYEANHVNAKWDTLWERLQELEKRKHEKGKSLPVIKYNFIATKRSITEIGLFTERVLVFKPRFLTLRELVVFPGMNQEYYDANRLTIEDQPKIAQAKRVLFDAGIMPIDSLQCTEESKKPVDSLPEMYPCIEPFFQLFIGPSGDIKVCNNLEKIGNLEQNSLKEIFAESKKSGMLRSLRRRSTCSCIDNCPNFVKTTDAFKS